jgi:hypothetical protein
VAILKKINPKPEVSFIVRRMTTSSPVTTVEKAEPFITS